MVANADEIRKHVFQNYIRPAFTKGKPTIEVYLSDVANSVKQEGDRSPYYQAIKAALTTKAFQNQHCMNVTENAYTSIVFTKRKREAQLLNISDSNRKSEIIIDQSPELDSKEGVIAKLIEYMDEVDRDEFANLVRAYARSRGFANVEIKITLKVES